MSKHIIGITREYTTRNGRRGVCYTLRGAKAASFIPAGVDALGWLMVSLGLAKGQDMKEEMSELHSLLAAKQVGEAYKLVKSMKGEEARAAKQWLLEQLRLPGAASLPALEGTPRQVAWAEDVRRDLLLERAVAHAKQPQAEDLKLYTVQLQILAERITDASAWLDNRQGSVAAIDGLASSIEWTQAQMEEIEAEINARMDA